MCFQRVITIQTKTRCLRDKLLPQNGYSQINPPKLCFVLSHMSHLVMFVMFCHIHHFCQVFSHFVMLVTFCHIWSYFVTMSCLVIFCHIVIFDQIFSNVAHIKVCHVLSCLLHLSCCHTLSWLSYFVKNVTPY